MNESRRLWMQALAAGSAGLSAGTVLAQAEPAAGRDFRAVNPAQPVEAPAGKIEVLEFFAYWCPHCREQKVLFGSAATKLPYVECDPAGRGAEPDRCLAADVRAY